VRFPLPGFAVYGIDADTVLVAYTSVVRHETWDYANRNSIWVRGSGSWRLRFHQATPANPQKGSRRKGKPGPQVSRVVYGPNSTPEIPRVRRRSPGS
jgi:hypothetical protein